MRIAIDARMMGAGNTRGIGRYIEQLVHAMTTVAPEHRYVLFMRDPARSPFQGNTSVEHIQADVPWYGLAEQTKMPALLASAKPDLAHIPHWNVPMFSRLPRVVTIHDLILLTEPQSATITTRGPIVAGIKRLGYRIALQRAVFASRRVLVPTEWVASDLRHRISGLTTPIDVTGEGMPRVDRATWMDPEMVHPYLLYVGSAYPHKNLEQLLDVWKKVADRHAHVSLVIAGERDTFMKRLEDRVAARHVPHVRFMGRVSDEELGGLYAKALAFIYPSRNEGFGLPPLEALAFGCPVISSDSTCLPEVLGKDGATFFRSGSADDILNAIETALRDPVGVRVRARQAVTALRARHDWRKAAERTLESYEHAHRNA